MKYMNTGKPMSIGEARDRVPDLRHIVLVTEGLALLSTSPKAQEFYWVRCRAIFGGITEPFADLPGSCIKSFVAPRPYDWWRFLRREYARLLRWHLHRKLARAMRPHPSYFP